MLVTLEYGPACGEQRHVERNQTTQLLLDLRLISAVLVAPPAPPVPTFGLSRSNADGRINGIFAASGGDFIRYLNQSSRDVEGARAFFKASGIIAPAGVLESLYTQMAEQAAKEPDSHAAREAKAAAEKAKADEAAAQKAVRDRAFQERVQKERLERLAFLGIKN